jgi:hypothetical protein
MLVVKKNIMPVRIFIQFDLDLILFFCLVKHVLNPLGLAKYEIRQNDKVVADVK